jgi:hypothetical protein
VVLAADESALQRHGEAALHRGVWVSLVVHAAIAVASLFVRARAHLREEPPPMLVDVVIEAPTVEPPAPPAPAASHDVKIGVAANATRHARAKIEEGEAGDPSKEVAEKQPIASGAPTCAEDEDCTLFDLNRCLSGDGAGCIGVGRYYERGRGDPFSAIKWYVKGCELGARASCEDYGRVSGSKPQHWDELRTSLKPAQLTL